MKYTKELQTIKDILLRVKENSGLFDMTVYQDGEKFAETESQLYEYGNSACVLGYIGVSPEFRESDGRVSSFYINSTKINSGKLVFGNILGLRSVCNFLGIDNDEFYEDFSILCYYSGYKLEYMNKKYSEVCGRRISDCSEITIDDAIAFVEYMMNKEYT